MTTANASYVRPDYGVARQKWEMIRAGCKGEAEVKALSRSLPYLNAHDQTDENKERNVAYRSRAVWFNAVGRTCSGLVGLAFRKDPAIEVGKYEYLKDNADGNGLSIYNSSQQALAGVLQTGRHGLLVDMKNGRPAIIGYDAFSIINWRTRMVDDGKGGTIEKLVLLVLEENVEDDSTNEFDLVIKKQWRVYRLVDGTVKITVYQETSEKTISVVDAPELKKASASEPYFTEIPFCFIGAMTNSAAIDDAPLQSLSDLNYAHFRNSADHEDSVFYVGQAQPWISGLSEEWKDFLIKNGIYVGSRAPLLLPEKGQFGIAQAQPNQLVTTAMASKEQQMVSLGARLVEMGTITKTATQAAGDIASSNSVLSLCCANVSEAYIRAIQFCGLFAVGTATPGANYRIEQEFIDVAIDAGMLTALIKSWQSGGFAKTDLRAYLRKVGIIAQERTDADIEADIEAEGPILGLPVNGDINPENTGVNS